VGAGRPGPRPAALFMNSGRFSTTLDCADPAARYQMLAS